MENADCKRRRRRDEKRKTTQQTSKIQTTGHGSLEHAEKELANADGLRLAGRGSRPGHEKGSALQTALSGKSEMANAVNLRESQQKGGERIQRRRFVNHGEEELAYSHKTGRLEQRGSFTTQQEFHAAQYDGSIWPTGPGAEQHEWEKPRIIEPGVGRTINGTANRTDELRLLGNGVVPATAALAWLVLTARMDAV